MRSGRPFELLTSHINDPEGLAQIGQYAKAAGAVRPLDNMRIGIIGHPFEGMTDLMVDYLSLRDVIGPVCWPLEPEKVAVAVEAMPPGRVQEFMKEQANLYDASDMPDDLFIHSAKLALALLDVCREYNFDGLATFDQILVDRYLCIGIIPSDWNWVSLLPAYPSSHRSRCHNIGRHDDPARISRRGHFP